MKKLVYLAVLFGGLFFVKPAVAQVSLSINIGSQPSWGPSGYEYARYYFIPEINMYYDVANRNYTYYQGNRWITHRNLPSRYRNFNFYNTYKVVVNDRNPWRNHDRYRRDYGRYANIHNQGNLRDYNRRSNDRYEGRRNDRYDGGRDFDRNEGRNNRIENNRDRRQENRGGYDNKDHKKSDRGGDRGNRGNGNGHGNGRR